MKVLFVKQSKIFNSIELKKIVKKLIELNSNLIVFGLPQSGKSTIVKAVCLQSKKFQTLNEEELILEEDVSKLKQTFGKKLWIISHQYPTLNENVPNNYLIEFAQQTGLNSKNWAIIRIKTKK